MKESVMEASQNDRIVNRNAEFLSAYVENHLVLFNSVKAEYYDLDPIAADIWEKLSVPQTMSALLDYLVATYEGDRETIGVDMKVFLDNMQARSMIRIEML